MCILFQYIYREAAFEKPFFSTYVRTSMFTLYLLGLCFWPPWREQCNKPATYMVLVDMYKLHEYHMHAFSLFLSYCFFYIYMYHFLSVYRSQCRG